MPPLEQRRPDIPDSVAICLWAIAAGRAGCFLQVVFRDYPAPVVRELFRFCTRWAGTRQHVHELYSLGDFRKLKGVLGDVRLVLVFEPRLLLKTSWLVAMHRRDGSPISTCPAVFAYQGVRHLDDDPGATLIIHGYPSKIASLTEWLRGNQTTALGRCPDKSPGGLVIDRRIDAL